MRRWWSAVVLCCFWAGVAGGQVFEGKLQSKLGTNKESDVPTLVARSKKAPEFGGIAAEDVEAAYCDSLQFGLWGAVRNLKVKACYVLLHGGEKRFFLDMNGDGQFSADEGRAFDSGADGVAMLKNRAAAEFQMPLRAGPYNSVPIDVWVVDKADEPRMGDKYVGIVYTAVPYVEGTLHLPERDVRVRFDYDARSGSVALDKAREWMDVNGDGKIDVSASSAEQGLVHEGTLPLFHIGGHFLRVARVDVAAGTFAVKSMPKPEGYTRIELVVGAGVPDFPFTDLQGHEHMLSTVRSKYTLLNFWATWCGPCIASMPKEKAAYDQFHAKGFEIVGVMTDDNPRQAKALLAKAGAPWPVADYNELLIRKFFQISQMPTLVLIDRNNRIVAMGDSLRGDELAVTLAKLLP